MEVGKILAEIRIFVDNGFYNLACTLNKLEAKPGHNAPVPVKLGEKDLAVSSDEYQNLTFAELKARLAPTLPGTHPGGNINDSDTLLSAGLIALDSDRSARLYSLLFKPDGTASVSRATSTAHARTPSATSSASAPSVARTTSSARSEPAPPLSLSGDHIKVELKVVPSHGDVTLTVTALALGVAESKQFTRDVLNTWRVRDLKGLIGPILKESSLGKVLVMIHSIPGESHLLDRHNRLESLIDNSKLEVCGIEFDREATYTLVFHPEKPAPTPAPAATPVVETSAPTQQKPSSTPASSAASHTATVVQKPATSIAAPAQLQPMDVELRIFLDDQTVNISCKGKYITKVNYHDQVIVREGDVLVPVASFKALTWGDLKAKLSHWPRTVGQGYYADAKKSFSDSDTLSSVGIATDEIKTNRYMVRWDIDPVQPAAPAPVAVATPTPDATSSFQPSSQKSQPTVSTAGSHVRKPSAPAGSGVLAKDDDVVVDVRYFLDSGSVSASFETTSKKLHASHDVSVPKSAWNSLTLGELKAKLGPKWTIKQGGTLMASHGPQEVSESSSMEKLGLIPATDGSVKQVQLVFVHCHENESLNSGRSSQATEVIHKYEPTSSGAAPAQLQPMDVEVRIFVDEQTVNISCKGKHIQKVNYHDQVIVKEGDALVSSTDYPKFTWGDLKAKLPHWPKTTSQGYYADGKKTFTDKDTLLGVGLVTDPVKTLRYMVRWDVDPVQPAAGSSASGHARVPSATSASSGLVYRSGSNYSDSVGTSSTHSTSTTHASYGVSHSAPNPNEIGVEVRMFTDGGIVNINITGRGHQFSASSVVEVSVPESQFDTFTWGALKRRLGPSWPKLADGGHLTGGEAKKFTDGYALVDVGVSPAKDGSTRAYQVAFMKA